MNKQLTDIISEYEFRLKSDPQNEELIFALATLLFSDNKIKKASELCEKLLETKSENPDYFNLAGLIKQRENKHLQAVRFFHKAIKGDNENLNYLNNLGISYSFLGLTNYADDIFSETLKLSDDPSVKLNYAFFLTKAKKYPEAEKYFDDLFDVYKSEQKFIINYLIIKYKLKKFGVVQKYLSNPENILDEAVTKVFQLSVFKWIKKDKYEESLEELKYFLNENTETVLQLFTELDLYNETEKCFTEITTDISEAYYYIFAKKYLIEGNVSEALGVFNKSINTEIPDTERILEFALMCKNRNENLIADRLFTLLVKYENTEILAAVNKFGIEENSDNKTKNDNTFPINNYFEHNNFWKGEDLSGKTLLVRNFNSPEEILLSSQILKKMNCSIIIECSDKYKSIFESFDWCNGTVNHYQSFSKNYDFETNIINLIKLQENEFVLPELKTNLNIDQDNKKFKVGIWCENLNGNETYFFTGKVKLPFSKSFEYINLRQELIKNKQDILEVLKSLDYLISTNNFISLTGKMLDLPGFGIYEHNFGIIGKSFFDKNDKFRFINHPVSDEIVFSLICSNTKIKVNEILNFGLKYTGNGELERAEILYNKSIEIQKTGEAYFRLGYIAGLRNDYEKAIGYYYTALEFSPTDINIYNNISSMLKELREFEKAEQILIAALNLNSESTFTLNNLAVVKTLLYKFDEATDLLQKSLQIDDKNDSTYVNLAIVNQHKNEINQAIENLKTAIKIDPQNANSRFNLACCLLKLKDYKNGLNEYEWRKQFPQYPKHKFSKEELVKQNINGKTILVYDEQGFGDTIQFARYLIKLKQIGAKVIFVSHDPLVGLFKNCSYIDKIFGKNDEIEQFEYDYHISLLSLPRYFGETYSNIFNLVRYIIPGKTKEINLPENKLNIGFVWKGRQTVNNLQRSADLKYFIDLFGVEGAQFHSLQKDEITDFEQSILEKYGILNYSDDLHSFSDTAELIEKLDVVITIDTAVAHLAGALGKTVWLLLAFNADWRWFDNKYSVYYPETEIFRQPKFLDWNSVFKEVKLKLTNYLNKSGK